MERALEPWSYGIYAGGQSILVGTPAGVTLAPEGGAHQSIKTPSIGLEQPGLHQLLNWPSRWMRSGVCSPAMGQMGRPDGRSAYLRLSTRLVDQGLAEIPSDPAARDVAGARSWPARTRCAGPLQAPPRARP